MPPGQASRNGATGARNARKRNGVALDTPLSDLLRFVEGVYDVPVAVLPCLHGDLAGGYYRRGERRVIILNADDPVARMRFTLAHELGHHYFHHLENIAELQGAPAIQDTRAGLRSPHKWWEVQANAFAAELLIPEPALARWNRERAAAGHGLEAVADLACRFGTSLTMACYRLRSAELVDDDQLERLRERINDGAGDALVRRHEPLDDGLARARAAAPRIPPALESSTFAAVASGRRAVADAAVTLRRDPDAAARALADLDLLPAA